MTDIFISYAATERDRLRPLKDALEAKGWSVFWDEKVPAGGKWRDHIFDNLKAARCVIVAWSSESVGRDWVREEAEYAKNRHVLLPVLIDPVELPFGFAEVQAIDLADWDGSPSSKSFQQLVIEIASITGTPLKAPGQQPVEGESIKGTGPSEVTEPPQKENKTAPPNKPGRRGTLGLAFALITVGGVAVGLYLGLKPLGPVKPIVREAIVIASNPISDSLKVKISEQIKRLDSDNRNIRRDARDQLIQMANTEANRQAVVDAAIGAVLPANDRRSYRRNIGILYVLSRVSGGWSGKSEQVKTIRDICGRQQQCEKTLRENHTAALDNLDPGIGD